MSPTESRPAFCEEASLVLLIPDDLIGSQEPWKNHVVPRRAVAQLRERGLQPSVKALGAEDVFELFTDVNSVSEEAGSQAMLCIATLEDDWVTYHRNSSRAGLRELLVHLAGAAVPTTVITAMADWTCAKGLRASTRLPWTPKVFGRVHAERREKVLTRAIEQALVDAGTDPGDALIVTTERQEPYLGSLGHMQRVSLTQGGWSTGRDLLDLVLECDLTPAEMKDISRRLTRRERITELVSQGSLTDAEMTEYAELTGGVRLVGNQLQFGFVDERVGFENEQVLRAVRRDAAASFHVLELLAADAALIETALRNWLIVHHDVTFSDDDRRTLGQILGLAENYRFAPALVDRIREFNSLRNDAVHRLSRGADSYFGLADRYMRDPVLLEDLEEFILDSAPVIWDRDREGY